MGIQRYHSPVLAPWMRIKRGLYAGSPEDQFVVNAAGEVCLHGNARVIRHLRIGAASWKLGASAPTAGFAGIFATLNFASPGTNEAHYEVIVPYRWDPSTHVECAVDWCYTGTQDNGTVKWGMEYKCVQNAAGTTVVGGTSTISKLSAGNHLTGRNVQTVFVETISKENITAEGALGLKLIRTAAEDTLSADAKALAVHLHFIAYRLGMPISS